MTTTHDKALALKALHEAPEILRVVNVWDAVSARVVADLPETGALPAAEYERMGVARISYGPLTQRVALRALRGLGSSLYADGVILEDTPALRVAARMRATTRRSRRRTRWSPRSARSPGS